MMPHRCIRAAFCVSLHNQFVCSIDARRDEKFANYPAAAILKKAGWPKRQRTPTFKGRIIPTQRSSSCSILPYGSAYCR